LCDLQGRTIRDAAGELGWPAGTVATRLTRGRARLAQRLLARGLGPAAPAVAVGVPAALVSSTVQAAAGAPAPAAAQLAAGVIRAMTVHKLKVLTAVLVAAGVVVAGVGRFAPARAEGQPPPAPVGRPKGAAGKADPAPVPLAKLLETGVWYPHRVDHEGRAIDVCDIPQGHLLRGPDRSPEEELLLGYPPTGGFVVKRLSIAKDAAITIDGQAGTLDKLPAGGKLRLKVGDGLVVTAIEVTTPPAISWPVVRAVDAKKRTVTVHLRDRDAATELAVAPDAAVTDRSGRDLALADLSAGTVVWLVVGVDGGRPVVKSISAWKN
jgi:hypothetical protein